MDTPPSAEHSVPWGPSDVVKAVAALAIFAGIGFAILTVWTLIGKPGGRWALLLALAPAEMVLLLAAWFFGVRRARGDWSSLGFRRFDVGQAFGLLLFAFVLALVLNVAYVAALDAVGLRELLPPSPRQLFGSGRVNLVIALVLAAGIAPVVEEAFFRGFVFPGLASAWGARWGAAASSVLFGVFHGSPGSLIPTSLLGLLLIWLYVRTGSIWPPVILHSLYNAAGVVTVFLTQGG